jgi:hypothetical protein
MSKHREGGIMNTLAFTSEMAQKIIADGTDWRFLNELKRELKV